MRSINYYEAASGEIVQQDEFEDGTLDADITAAAPVGTVWIESTEVDINTDYVVADVITARPMLTTGNDDEIPIVADGLDSVTFAMPTGTTVTFQGVATVSVAAESFTFTTLRRGTFEFIFEPPWPTLPLSLTITTDTEVQIL
jgi:hypothetical protein